MSPPSGRLRRRVSTRSRPALAGLIALRRWGPRPSRAGMMYAMSGETRRCRGRHASGRACHAVLRRRLEHCRRRGGGPVTHVVVGRYYDLEAEGNPFTDPLEQYRGVISLSAVLHVRNQFSPVIGIKVELVTPLASPDPQTPGRRGGVNRCTRDRNPIAVRPPGFRCSLVARLRASGTRSAS